MAHQDRHIGHNPTYATHATHATHATYTALTYDDLSFTHAIHKLSDELLHHTDAEYALSHSHLLYETAEKAIGKLSVGHLFREDQLRMSELLSPGKNATTDSTGSNNHLPKVESIPLHRMRQLVQQGNLIGSLIYEILVNTYLFKRENKESMIISLSKTVSLIVNINKASQEIITMSESRH